MAHRSLGVSHLASAVQTFISREEITMNVIAGATGRVGSATSLAGRDLIGAVVDLALPDLALSVSIVTNGLMAGLFFVFAVAICPGFRRLDDRAYVRAFTSINAAILNPMFLTVFVLAPATSLLCALLHMRGGLGASALPAIAGAGFSVVSFGITVAGNVPLNQALDRAPHETERQCAQARHRFEGRWGRLNVARTCASIASLACLAIAAVR